MSRRTNKQMRTTGRRSYRCDEGRTLADVHDGVLHGQSFEEQIADLGWFDRELFYKALRVLETQRGTVGRDELLRKLKRATGALSPAAFGLFQAWWRSVEVELEGEP